MLDRYKCYASRISPTWHSNIFIPSVSPMQSQSILNLFRVYSLYLPIRKAESFGPLQTTHISKTRYKLKIMCSCRH